MKYELTPSTELEPGEKVIAEFTPDRATYWRNMATLAAIAMAAGMAILWAIGNPYVWTGAIGGLAAIGIRSWYVASDELGMRWDLTNRRLLGPGGRAVLLTNISKVRSLGSAVQVVTVSGDKHLVKYLDDPAAAMAEIDSARGRA